MKNTKVTFELKDLSYDELIETYKDIVEFLKFLNESLIPLEEEEEKKE